MTRRPTPLLTPESAGAEGVDDEALQRAQDDDCDKCGGAVGIRGSRGGPFLACSGFPQCRNAKPLPDELREQPREADEACDRCGQAMVVKTSRWGRELLACSAYPSCRNRRDVPGEMKDDGAGGAGDPVAPGAEAGAEAAVATGEATQSASGDG